ncbi:MAG: OsmC family protein [Nitriliruptorales bacterium]|nr:OsmC family protein [Nitriliruptorales bacterium]
MHEITATLDEGYAVTIETDQGHTWHADEPEEAGGTDTGPNPYELLMGSLAACTAITLSMYAQRKGWELAGVEATYRHDRIHADDCEDCDDETKGYIDHVTSEITIRGELDDQQRKRLAEVAERCPVHKTLEKGVHITDEVSFS